MILEIRFNNYKMYKGENVLSFNADTRIKRLSSNYVNVLNKNVLKSVALYGQNNIGKSNLFSLLMFVCGLMSGKENIPFNRSIFKDTATCDISIVYKTDTDNNWMEYSFIYDSFNFEIVKEELNEVIYYETGNLTKKNVYYRYTKKNELIVLNQNLNDISSLFTTKKSFLYCISMENNIFNPLRPYLASFKSFVDSVEFVELYNIPINKTIETLKGKDDKKKKFIVEFIKHADLSVQGFSYNDKAKFSFSNNEKINEEVLHKINTNDVFKLFTEYSGTRVPSIMFDSTGTKKIEALASYIYESIIIGKTLVIDELDNGLHFKLSRAVLSAFNSFINLQGQLLFTAHDIELISCKYMMRKDQIYFSFRNLDLSSNLFCLKDATAEKGGPRTAEDIMKHYSKSEFGYVPSPNFVKHLINMNKEGTHE